MTKKPVSLGISLKDAGLEGNTVIHDKDPLASDSGETGRTERVADVTPEQVKAAVEKAQRKFWKVHDCSMCGYPCGYRFGDAGAVAYDSGCYCVNYCPNIQPRDFADVARQINVQNDEWRKKLWDEISSREQR